ncbi:MAG: hypothetical protein WCV00_06255 [Verrucomicrobiia bacterium]
MSAILAILQQLDAEAVLAPAAEAAADTVVEAVGDPRALDEIYKLNAEFESRYKDKLRIETALSRPLVSFQANKGRVVYRHV